MKSPHMKRLLRISAVSTAALVLAGCASVNFDQALGEANQNTQAFSQGKLELSRTEAQRQARQKLSEQLLADPLSMDDAVQLALASQTRSLLSSGCERSTSWNSAACCRSGCSTC